LKRWTDQHHYFSGKKFESTLQNNQPTISMKNQSNWKQKIGSWPLILVVPALPFALCTSSCRSPTESEEQTTALSATEQESLKLEPDSIENLLRSVIDISAKDFNANQKPLPTAFRNVQFKYIIKPNNETLYILCGQFQVANEGKWTPFTTIKNYDYEQWIGNSGLHFCQDAIEIPHNETDLSLALKQKLSSLGN